jgi:hypothetical protein
LVRGAGAGVAAVVAVAVAVSVAALASVGAFAVAVAVAVESLVGASIAAAAGVGFVGGCATLEDASCFLLAPWFVCCLGCRGALFGRVACRDCPRFLGAVGAVAGAVRTGAGSCRAGAGADGCVAAGVGVDGTASGALATGGIGAVSTADVAAGSKSSAKRSSSVRPVNWSSIVAAEVSGSLLDCRIFARLYPSPSILTRSGCRVVDGVFDSQG